MVMIEKPKRKINLINRIDDKVDDKADKQMMEEQHI